MSAASPFRVYDPAEVPPGPATLADVVRERITHLDLRVAADNLSAEARDRYRCTLLQLTSWVDPKEPSGAPLGELPLKLIRQEHFSRWLLHHLPRWPSGNTRRDKIHVVLDCLRWAVDELAIDPIPWRKPKEIRCPAVPKPPMEEEHYVAIMRAAMARTGDKRHKGSRALRRGLYFCYHTGVRPQEMRELEPDHIHFAKRHIRLRNHKTRHHTAEDRLIAFDCRIERLLRNLVARMQPGQQYVFVSEHGRPWNKDTWNRTLVRYARPAGVPKAITAYCSRHGFGCVRVRAGQDRKAIADLMGHRDTRMIERVYAASTRNDAEHLSHAMDSGKRRKRKMPQAVEPERAAELAALKRAQEAEQFPLFEHLD